MTRTRIANAGGEIAPDEVVGRDALVDTILSTLALQSVLMVAERRMGKTTVLKKMRHAPPEGFKILFRDVESVRSPLEFAEAVAKDVQTLLPATAWATSRLGKLYQHVAGAELGGILKFPAALAPHWKELLQASIASVVEAHPKVIYVFAWDELPYMLDKICRSTGETDAMDVLDTLRGLRQTHRNLRMIYSGSIGLHHVLTSMREAGHHSAPVNDMRTIEVAELDEPFAITLATELIAGERLTCAQPEDVARLLCQFVDRVPYYIHHVVADLRSRQWQATPGEVERAVHHALVDAHDPWNLMHYRSRIDLYYQPDQVPMVLAVLDGLDQGPLSFSEIAQRVRTTKFRAESPFIEEVVKGDDEPLRKLLDLLARDHYLRRDPDTLKYAFRFSLIQRWWRRHRGA